MEAIESIQEYIDSYISTGSIKFKNPEKDYDTIEEIYNAITDRRYVKFCKSCGGVIKEALTIINNWKNREVEAITELNNQLVIDVKNATEETVDGVIEQYNADLEHITNPFNPEGYDNDQIENPNVVWNQDGKTGLFKATVIEDDSDIIKAYIMQDDLTKEVEEPKPIQKVKTNGRKRK